MATHHISTHTSTSANACIQKHLHTKPAEVSTILDGKQSWGLLSHAGQVSGITSAHNMIPHTHTHTCRAVNISNISPFPLQGRQKSSRSSVGLSPSLVIISFTLHTAREMNHGERCHSVWEREGGPDVPCEGCPLWSSGVCLSLCVSVDSGVQRGAKELVQILSADQRCRWGCLDLRTTKNWRKITKTFNKQQQSPFQADTHIVLLLYRRWGGPHILSFLLFTQTHYHSGMIQNKM